MPEFRAAVHVGAEIVRLLGALAAVYRKQTDLYRELQAATEAYNALLSTEEVDSDALLAGLEGQVRVVRAIEESDVQAAQVKGHLADHLSLPTVHLSDLRQWAESPQAPAGAAPALTELSAAVAVLTEVIQGARSVALRSEHLLRQRAQALREEIGHVQKGRQALRAYSPQRRATEIPRFIDKKR